MKLGKNLRSKIAIITSKIATAVKNLIILSYLSVRAVTVEKKTAPNIPNIIMPIPN